MIIHKEILRSSLEELSNREDQEKYWLGKSPGLMSSFVEACCCAFDNSRLGDALDEGFVAEQYGKAVESQIKELRKLLNQIPYNKLTQEDIISLPVMNEIRKISLQLLRSNIFD